MTFCPVCGVEADESAKFCKECGHQLKQVMARDRRTNFDRCLDKVEEIAKIKQQLPVAKQSQTSLCGLYVESRPLSGNRTRIIARCRFRPDLVFTLHPDGTRTVEKVRSGPWESKVDETLDLVRRLQSE